MANIEQKINVSVSDIDSYKTLIELLSKHKDSLPSEIVECVNKIADGEAFEYDVEWLRSKGFATGFIYADGVEIEKSVSANKILKRVSVFGGADLFPEHCQLIANDTVLMEW